MRNYYTVDQIRTEMEVLNRNITGRKSFTAVENDVVLAAIIDAYQHVLLEYGVETFTFQEVAETVVTVSGQSYVDLTEYVYKVVNGSVRIPSEDETLSLIDEIAIYQQDPDLDYSSCPSNYAYAASGDPNVIRLKLWPIPDAVYTINMQVYKYPTDVITEFPTFLMSAIKLQAKGLSCLGLGLGQLKPQFDQAYGEIIAKIKDGYNNDGPRHVGRLRLKGRPYYTKEE